MLFGRPLFSFTSKFTALLRRLFSALSTCSNHCSARLSYTTTSYPQVFACQFLLSFFFCLFFFTVNCVDVTLKGIKHLLSQKGCSTWLFLICQVWFITTACFQRACPSSISFVKNYFRDVMHLGEMFYDENFVRRRQSNWC